MSALWLEFVSVLLQGWLAWCLLNLVLMVVVAPLIAHEPMNTGLAIIMPDNLRETFTQDEIAALYAHEEGHTFHRHVWWAYLRLCLFLPCRPHERIYMELEADRYAGWHGHAGALISALQKYANDPRQTTAGRAFLGYRIALLEPYAASAAPTLKNGVST